MLDNITFIIKTFKRYECLERMLESIEKFYPGAEIIVADDNKKGQYRKAFYSKWPNVKVVRLPFDSGLSMGRNKAIEKSNKEFILLLDDDFIFTEDTRIDKFYKIMNHHRKIGIVGGMCIENSKEVHYEHNLELNDGVLRMVSDGEKWTRIEGILCKKTGCVLNFALFRKELFKEVKWDDGQKIVEHTDFYLQMKRKRHWVIYYTPEVKVIHDKKRDIGDYKMYRLRTNEFFKRFFDKWKLVKHIDRNGHSIQFSGNKMIKRIERI